MQVAPSSLTNSAVNSILGAGDLPDRSGFGGLGEAHSGVDVSALGHRRVIKMGILINRDMKFMQICSDPDFGKFCTELYRDSYLCTEWYRVVQN